MMYEREKSDSAEVARKLTNGGEGTPSESVERRAGAEGNTDRTCTRRTRSRASVFPGLERVRERARQEKKERFTALLHHVNVDRLRAAFGWLKRDAAPGVDGLTWREYEQGLEERLVDLHARVHRGAYRTLPSRRKFIPKEDGRLRPLAVAALEDKIVQRAVVSPTLANIYLHYTFDLWAERWRHRQARGNVIYVRYADDIVVGFEHEEDAQRFRAELRERLEKFAEPCRSCCPVPASSRFSRSSTWSRHASRSPRLLV